MFEKIVRAMNSFWLTLKPVIASRKRAVRRRFFFVDSDPKHDFGIDLEKIGKITPEELSILSVLQLKNLYSLYYFQVFGLSIEFPDKLMPEADNEFAWPICVPGIISNCAAYCNGKNEVDERALGLNNTMLCFGRDTWTHSYIVRVRPKWEANEDLSDISYKDVLSRELSVLTFRERWILGSFVYWLTGDFLDKQSGTLTSSYIDRHYICTSPISLDTNLVI